MSQLTAIKDRRRTIINLRKVTRAMELVTQTRIAKMRLNAKNAHNYQQAFYELASTIVTRPEIVKKTDKPLRYVICFFSQKGFCGNFNDKLLSFFSAKIKELSPDRVYILGKQTSKWSYVLHTEYTHIEAREKTYQKELQPLIELWQKAIVEGQQIEIYIVYNKFNSILDQQPQMDCIYPFATMTQNPEQVFCEPSQNELAEQLSVAYLQSCLEKVYWESAAGEYCSRLLSMKNANDNASIIIDELTLEYNKTRQAKITQELSEIVSAFDVLKLVQEKKQRSAD